MPIRQIDDPDVLKALLHAVLLIESDLDLTSVLHKIIEEAVALSDATYGALGVLNTSGTGLSEFITIGLEDEEITSIGDLPTGGGVLGLLISEPQPIRLDHIAMHPTSHGFPPHHPPMDSFLGVPIRIRDVVFGNLYLTDKRGAAEFTQSDENTISVLAVAAGIAIENARQHSFAQDLRLAEDRDRIAKDLHDTVIQRLFATGLSLQSLIRLTDAPELISRIEEATDQLDVTIRQIRTTIFALGSAPKETLGFRARVLELVSESARGLGFEPTVSFAGPIDFSIDGKLEPSVLAAMREALANMARHAQASDASVEVSTDGEDFTFEVTDNGVGIPDTARSGGGKGLRNMIERAQSAGGVCMIERSPSGGTRVSWKVPLTKNK